MGLVDLLETDEDVKRLFDDAIRDALRLKRVRDLYRKNLNGQWLCEYCGALQPSSAYQYEDIDTAAEVCCRCHLKVMARMFQEKEPEL
ncbi:MAG: hypothetical protein V1797_09470 [Pseudomonadota bacterium]